MSTGVPHISHQLSDSLLQYVMVDDIFIFYFLGGNMMFFKHVKCQNCEFYFSLSDAKVRDSSARIYSTKPSVCLAFTDELRHAKMFSTPKLFRNVTYLFCILFIFEMS